MIKASRFILLMTISCFATGCDTFPRFYLGADKIHGSVVDSETKEPIENVVVVAAWELYGGLIEREHTANLVLLETVTDKNGNYSFDSWGPRFTISGYLEDSSPLLIFYKTGYISEGLRNQSYSYPPASYKRSDWTGKVINLKKYSGSVIDYAKETTWLDDFIYAGYAICDWKHIPRYTAEMIKLNDYLAINHASAYGGPRLLTRNEINVNAVSCGFDADEVDELLGKYIDE